MRRSRPYPCWHGLGVCTPCYRSRFRTLYGFEPEFSKSHTGKGSVRLDEVDWVYPPLANARRRPAFRRWAKKYRRVKRVQVARKANV